MISGRAISNNKAQINSLDGLRGLAILIVFFAHTSNEKILLLPFLDLYGIGKGGVYLFFILSSFLLTLPFIKMGKKSMTKAFFLKYAYRRFMRIYPLYILYLAGILIVSYLVAHVQEPVVIPFYLSLKEFTKHLFVLQGNGLTWSIVIEFRYYLILPILGLIYSILFKNRVLPSLLFTVALIITCQIFWPQAESLAPSDSLKLWPYLPLFFLGGFLAVIFYNWQEGSLQLNVKQLYIIEFFGLISVLLLIVMTPAVSSWLLGKKLPLHYFHFDLIQYGVLWSVIILSCLLGAGMFKKIFETPFLRYMGFISFSFYLSHLFVLTWINQSDYFTNMPLKGWVILALTIIISHISWKLIEVPSSRINFMNILGAKN